MTYVQLTSCFFCVVYPLSLAVGAHSVSSRRRTKRRHARFKARLKIAFEILCICLAVRSESLRIHRYFNIWRTGDAPAFNHVGTITPL